MVTGICADSAGRPRVRINNTPALRDDDAPPKLRTCASTFSAVCSGFSILALLTKITLASKACAKEAFKSLAKASRAVGTKPSTITMSWDFAIWRCKLTASSRSSSVSPSLSCCVIFA
jgi:hypothetical protein